MIHKIIDDGIDIDKILIVTFTNAAASEMRERILDAIYKKLEENPEDNNLHRQITLLNKASICTIHSFCLDVIRNHFYEIDTSANFRIGDTAEIELLKSEVLEELFEEKYEKQDEGFLKLLETYTNYRGDEALAELVLNIYKYIQSSPFPEQWLEEKIEMFHKEIKEDFSQTVWGKIVMQEAKEMIEESIIRLQNTRNDTLRFQELEKYSNVLEQDINHLQYICENMGNWDKTYQNLLELNWAKWPVDKKVTIDLKNEAKEIRDKVKKQISGIKIIESSDILTEDIRTMYGILKELQKLIQEFSSAFTAKKQEKNIIDFNDIEHLALKILIHQTENGIEPSDIAKKYRDKFVEIAIDEYQDSNLVQEYILNSISNGNNIFMVGDVKQSIYKFRQARPELFLEKYAKYQLKEEKKQDNGLKIQLFKNFRSRENILNVTNLIFEDIMSEKLGDVEYTNVEYLNYGANYPKLEKKISEPEEINSLDVKEKQLTQKDNPFAGLTELNIIDLKDAEEKDIYKDKKQEENSNNQTEQNNNIRNKESQEQQDIEQNEETEERIENAVIEAKFIANRIKNLLDSNYMIFDKKQGYRKITYKDICILLRATSSTAPIYEKEIAELDLPVFSDTSSTYLDSMEVQIIMSLLKIIDNPMQDIPLVTVLRSSIGNFNDNELIQIRLADKNSTFYEAMLKARLVADKELKEKIEILLKNLENWRKQEEYLPLNEFIWKLYMDTEFYHYVSLLTNGDLRQANLKLLFEKAKQYEKASFKGLFNFINFIDKVKISSGDMGSAKLIGENENVIRIMSIHKSKGLEFPVVFLCGTGKKFNLQDLNKPILLHQDIGFGPKLIDTDRKIEYNTIAQEAIRIQTRKETIAEEMRILYVALTRAKEKLIITGLSKDLNQSLQEKEKLLNIYKNNSNKINTSLVKKYISYLDWLELVYLHHKDSIKNVIELKEYKKKDFLKEIKQEEKNKIDIEEILKEQSNDINNTEEKRQLRKRIEERLQWKYPHEKLQEIPTKTSVTKLKKIEEENTTVEIDIEDIIKLEERKKANLEIQAEGKENIVNLTLVPKFMEQEQKLTPAQKGTLMHLCVQKLDEKREYTEKDIEEFVENLYQTGIISKIELKAVNKKILYRYTQSELWKDLKQAKEIHKEQPFYINLPAKTIYDKETEEENILVQGIIDLYYISKDNKLILVDFKTDYVKKRRRI